jgi:hypothetical protein
MLPHRESGRSINLVEHVSWTVLAVRTSPRRSALQLRHQNETMNVYPSSSPSKAPVTTTRMLFSGLCLLAIGTTGVSAEITAGFGPTNNDTDGRRNSKPLSIEKVAPEDMSSTSSLESQATSTCNKCVDTIAIYYQLYFKEKNIPLSN